MSFLSFVSGFSFSFELSAYDDMRFLLFPFWHFTRFRLWLLALFGLYGISLAVSGGVLPFCFFSIKGSCSIYTVGMGVEEFDQGISRALLGAALMGFVL